MIHIPRQLADDLQAWPRDCEASAREAVNEGKPGQAIHFNAMAEYSLPHFLDSELMELVVD